MAAKRSRRRAKLRRTSIVPAARSAPAEVARTEHALRELDRRKDDFLAMLSHELRNPLSPIRTSVAVLQLAPAGSEEAKEAIAIIDRSAAHLTRLVDDLLDVTRLTRGAIELERGPVELVALVRRAVEDLQANFTQHRLECTTAFPEPEIWVHADAARLTQVMCNVLGNADKFTPPGGRVDVRAEYVDGTAIIRVEDTGIGIAPELIGDLFEPFAQAPQSLDRGGGGLGLGLTKVKSLVELHGGRVTVRSGGVGMGTEVVIALPAQGTAPSHGEPATAPTATRRKVMIIEDMPDCAHSLQQALKLKGHDVRVAYNGRSGLELIAVFKPDIVLCDIGLPDIDGFEVAMQVRTNPVSKSLCLVALTGYSRPGDIERAKAVGFDRHLTKPADLPEIEALLASIPD